MFSREPLRGLQAGKNVIQLRKHDQYSTFSAKINDLNRRNLLQDRFWQGRSKTRLRPGMPLGPPPQCGAEVNSVSGSRIGRKILLEFAFNALEFLGVGRRIFFLRDVGPAFGVFRVHLEPLLQSRLGVWLDGFGRTFGFTDTAIDALIGMNDEHVLALIEAVDGANLNAISVFALNAGIVDDVSHPRLRRIKFAGWGTAGTAWLQAVE
jgi:hypothetical protein